MKERLCLKVHHCVCPVVIARFLDDGPDAGTGAGSVSDGNNGAVTEGTVEKEVELHPVPEICHL